MPLLKNFPAPTEGVHHCEPNTTAYFEEKELGKGTLYIAESILCWLSSAGEGFSLSYSSVVIHATSKDTNTFPKPCLFVIAEGQLDISGDSELTDAMNTMSVEEQQNGKEDEDEEISENSDKSTQLYFVPDNQEMLDTMYRAMCDCQALHPEPGHSEDSEDGDGIFASPNFNIINGSVENYEEDSEDDEMNEDQFEDAE